MKISYQAAMTIENIAHSYKMFSLSFLPFIGFQASEYCGVTDMSASAMDWDAAVSYCANKGGLPKPSYLQYNAFVKSHTG